MQKKKVANLGAKVLIYYHICKRHIEMIFFAISQRTFFSYAQKGLRMFFLDTFPTCFSMSITNDDVKRLKFLSTLQHNLN